MNDVPAGDGPSEPGKPPANGSGPTQPSLVPGTVLLGIAALLIVIVLVKPDMPAWLKTTIAIVAVLVVLALLVIAFQVFRGTTKRNR